MYEVRLENIYHLLTVSVRATSPKQSQLGPEGLSIMKRVLNILLINTKYLTCPLSGSRCAQCSMPRVIVLRDIAQLRAAIRDQPSAQGEIWTIIRIRFIRRSVGHIVYKCFIGVVDVAARIFQFVLVAYGFWTMTWKN